MQSSMLERFLAERHLTQPDGRELFRYHTTDHEFAEMERLLRLSLANISPARCASIPGFAQWFVLWASEWWRREYDGANFSWARLLGRLHCADDVWTQEERSRCIKLGMAGWQRPLRAPEEPLLHPALEGGIPLRLLALGKDGGVLALLTLVVYEVAGKQCGIREIRSKVEQEQDMLPPAYRQKCLFMALAEIVMTVLRLGKQAGASRGASDKVVFRLNQDMPAWRELLPFPLDDDRTQVFLPQLMETAAVTPMTPGPIVPSMPEIPSRGVTPKAQSSRPTKTPNQSPVPDQAPSPRPAQVAEPTPDTTGPIPTVSAVPQWSGLDRFLQQRGLSQPDGRELFLYRTTDEEFTEIQKKLQEMLAARPGAACAGDRVFAQWFVLWASEWWRRCYEGANISWTPIFDALGCSADVWTQEERSDCVFRGLQRWRRPLRLQGGFHYILSIALEGGLPLRLVAEGRGGLGGLLKRVLEQAIDTQAGKEDIRGWVESLKDMLPKSYRQPVIFMLLTDIIVTVLDLRRTARLTDGDNVIEILERHDSNWRERFPLPLDDAQAQGLLARLFEESAETARDRRQHASPFVLERSLEENAQGWRLCASLPLPEALELDKLAAFFSIVPDVLPRQAELTLRAGEKMRTVPVRRMAGRDQVRMKDQFADLLDAAAAQEHALELALDEGQTVSAPVSQGMELDEELPWVFSAASGHRFLGQGNVRTKEAEVLLAVPESWQAPVAEDGGMCADAGELPFCSRKIWRVRGTARVADVQGEQFRLRTGRPDAEQQEFVWRGERLWYGFTNPVRAFRGVPTLYTVNAQGVPHMVAGEPVFLALGTKQAVQEGPVVGIYTVGESNCRARMVLLPPNARMEIRGHDAHSGEIRLHQWGVNAARTLTETVRIDFDGTVEPAVLRCSTADGAQAPEQVDLNLFWPHTPTPARLKLPYPARGVRAFGMDGLEWRDEARIAPNRLLGARILVHTDDLGTRIRLRMRSSGQFGRSFPIGRDRQSLQVIIRLQHYEEEIRRMLAMNDALDHAVSLCVLLDDREVFHLKVLRYESFLEPLDDKTKVRLDADSLQTLASRNPEKIRLQACNMLRESDRIVDLEAAHAENGATDAWLFPWENRLPGPWLLFPSPDSPVALRPMRITVAGEARADFWLAEVMDEPDEAVRMASLVSAMETLAADYAHKGWEEVEQWAARIGHLSLTAFDLWRAFARRPAAMAALVLRAPNLVLRDFVRRFPLELPFAWPVVGFADWKQAMALLRDQCAAQYGPDAETVFRAQMDAVINQLTDEYPELQFMLGIAASCFLDDRRQEVQALRLVAPQLANDLFNGGTCAVQRLFHRHSDDAEHWPDIDALHDSWRNAQNEAGYAPYFCPTNFIAHRLRVINLPILLALHCVTGASGRWLREPALFRMLCECRAFDPEWFETAYNYTIARCLADDLLKVNE